MTTLRVRHPGAGERHGYLSGSRIDDERRKIGGIKLLSVPGKRFCESCQQHKPRGTAKAVKGWRCGDCLTPAPRSAHS